MSTPILTRCINKRPRRITGADVFLLVRDQPFSFSVKSFMTSEILICWGHTASQLRQPTQAEGFFSSGPVSYTHLTLPTILLV